MDKETKKQYEPVSRGLAIFLVGLLLSWLCRIFDFNNIAIILIGLAILGFLYSCMCLQRLINHSIDDKIKNRNKN